MEKDLTKGSPLKQILIYTLPVLIGGIFQQIYSLADTLIVGRTISTAALASVGLTGPLSFLMQGIAMGITSGYTVFTSQRFGAKDTEGVKRSIAANIITSAFLSVFLTLVCTLLTGPMLRLMQVPEELFKDAYNYLLICFLGFTGIIFYNMFSQLLRALGDSQTPLYFLIFTCAVNVGLDFAFILGAKMGVSGAALATVISQFLSVVLCMIYAFWKYPVFRLKKEHWKATKKFYWDHIRIGLPMALQFSITAIGVLINQSFLNTLGETAIATYSAAGKVEQFLSQTFVAVGLATATFTAQNFGAGNYKRIKTGLWISIAIEVVLAVIACVIVLTLSGPILKIFLPSDVNPDQLENILSYGRTFFFTNGPAYIVLALLFVFRNALQGVGKSIGTMFGGIAELVLRVVSVVLFVKVFQMGFQGICIANPAAWVGAMIVQVILFVYFFGKIKKSPTGNVGDAPPSETIAVSAQPPEVQSQILTGVGIEPLDARIGADQPKIEGRQTRSTENSTDK